jgi:hypothetical protein
MGIEQVENWLNTAVNGAYTMKYDARFAFFTKWHTL